MRKTISRLVVVDASVMRSAGETEHPVSSACRKTLKTILEVCHRVLISKDIQDEWNNHASRYSRRWIIAMMNRRKVSKSNASLAPLKLKGIDKYDRIIIEKDRHLLDAAYTTDRIIITTDDKFQKALLRTSNTKMLKEVRWLNPCKINANELHHL